MKCHGSLACALILGACSPQAGDAPARAAHTVDSAHAPASEWKIVPGRAAGPLTPETSEAELRQRYDPRVVKRIRVEIGEGETMPGTVLFEGDSLRRAEVIWHDTLGLRRPARLILRGSRSLWQAGSGISLGTSLQELERLNGRPFTLAGFGWDYGGVVTDWNGGALDRSLTGIKLYLYPAPDQYNSAAYSQVLGDRDYSSGLPPMQQLNPRVAQIFVDFE